MERDRRRTARLSGAARRLLSLALLCTASTWSIAGPARADTAPSNSGPPTISGTAQEGDVLTADPGTWSGDAPISFSYQWSDGQTGSSVTLSSTDVDQSLTVTVTASNAAGEASATSDSFGPILPAAPVNGEQPVISGTPQQGDTLSVSNGTWSENPTTFSYVWQDCDSTGNHCVAIPSATSNTYTLQASDVDSTIVASVTASNAGGPGSASSGAVGPVLPPAPVNGALPVITGTAQQGDTLSVSNGTWSNNPTGFAYVWEDCDSTANNCAAIPGATSSSYTLQATDVDSRIVAVVTATNAGGDEPASSAATASVLPAAPAIDTAPGISGIAQQGKTLSVSNGTWSNNPTAFAYVWQDCGTTGSPCLPISNATANTYTPQASDVGQYVSVKVTASNAGGRTSVSAATVGPVLPPAPANTQAPTISGTAEQGDTLRVSNGTWDNNPTSFSYAWESCNSPGGSCTPIGGATSNSYALSAADIGSRIACVVTATGPGGSTSVTTSKSGVVVASPIPAASQPTTTDLLTTPNAPVTNQAVTLIATVTAGTSSTALWGAVTFENGGTAIPGCANMPAVPSGGSATVACSASFTASRPQLSAVFSPAAGSVLIGSVSPSAGLTVGPDSSSTSLGAPSSVNVGASITYTATVAPPAARPGPVQPTGTVEFLDGGQPIGSCASLPLSGGAAACTVSYGTAGTHQITARYSGDANFNGSSSPAEQVTAAAVPTSVLGTITATMQWAFYFTPGYTVVRGLVVNGVSAGAKVTVKCHGRGCPFGNRMLLAKRKQCGRKAKRPCPPPGTLNLTPAFAGRHLAVGARITISIVRPNWIGKSYRFTIRPRRGPRVQIGCLAPGGSTPGVGC